MKPARTALYLAVTGILSACAYQPLQETAARRVSQDYMASGGIEDARAYFYGKVTVLEFGEAAPAFVTIRDEAGNPVEYERAGRYYRLPRVLDSFTVWANGRSVTFSAPTIVHSFSAITTAPEPLTEPAQAASVVQAGSEAPAGQPGDADVAALLKLNAGQLAKARRLLDEADRNPQATGQELFDVYEHLDTLEARMRTAATVQVHFPAGVTTFRPSPGVAKILVAAGRAASWIVVRGHTDAKVGGPADAGIALGRAQAARSFLIAHGIAPGKIEVSSKAAGDFVAPNVTKEGRAMNRRVEIVFFHPRIAELGAEAFKLAAGRMTRSER